MIFRLLRRLAPVSLLALMAAAPGLAATLVTVPPDKTTGVTLANNDALEVSAGGTVSNGHNLTAVTGTGVHHIHVDAGGTIKGDNAAAITLSNGLHEFINAGNIVGQATFGSAITVANGAVGSFNNSGTMSGSSYNAVYFDDNQITSTVTVGTFTNSGTITAHTDQTVRIGGAVTTFTNAAGGKILHTGAGSSFAGTAILFRGAVDSFDNAGTISSADTTIVFRKGVTDGTNSKTITESGNTNSALLIQGTAISSSFTNTATGTIKGANGIVFASDTGGSTITNNGTIEATKTGGTAISFGDANDFLNLTPTSHIIGIVDALGGTDRLTLGGTGSATFAVNQFSSSGQYRHFEEFFKTGASNWTLSGNNSATMEWDVFAGSLAVNGSMPNSFFNVTGGTLKGHGTTGNVSLFHASIAPGNSVGTIHVDDIDFAGGSSYLVEVAGGVADKIVASGTVFLNGGTVVVDGSASACNDLVLPILTSTQALTDQFAGITGAGTLSYDSHNVYLNFTGSGGGRTFTGFGRTPNQNRTAIALDALGCNNQPYSAALNALSDADVPKALDALSGEGHASIAVAMLEQSHAVGQAIRDRVQQAFDAVDSANSLSSFAPGGSILDPVSINGVTYWGSGYGGVITQAGDGNAAPMRSSAGGFVFGADGKITEDWRIGLMGGFGVEAIDARATTGSSADASIGGYAGGQLGIVDVKAGAAYTRHFISTNRVIDFPGVHDVMSAGYGAGTAQAFVEISKDFDAGPVTLTPYARFEGMSHATDAFTETGGAGKLRTRASVANALFVTLGLGAEDKFVLDGMLITARGSVGWRHAFADDVTVANSFAGGGPFTIASAGIARDVAVVSAGVNVEVSENVTVGISYEGALGSGLGSHAVKLTLAGRF